VRIVRIGFGGQERLSEDDYARFDSYIRMTFRRYDSVLFHHRQGTLIDEAWVAYWNSFKKALASPGVQTAWRRHSDENTASFQAIVEQEIEALRRDSRA
jgi:hypothetical protein